MVMVPVLVLPVVLAAILYETVPEPLPLLPEVTVIHEALLTAVQEQLLDDGVTATVSATLCDEYPTNLLEIITEVQAGIFQLAFKVYEIIPVS